MAATLPLQEQIAAACRMAQRCHIHLGLWRLTAGVEGRQRHLNVLRDQWEHMRFLEHGQLFTAVVELHSLLDANSATINLPHLVQELGKAHGPQPLLKKALEDTQPVFKKLRVLRNNVYSHRTRKRSYTDVFKAAAITPDQLQELVLTCVRIANELRVAIGQEAQTPSPLPAECYERMLTQLRGID